MKFFNVIFLILSLIIISACSSSYKKLSQNSHNPPDNFAKYLLDNYSAKADFEAKEMHDWNSAKLYAEKALRAVSGEKIKPEKINSWKISDDKINELHTAYKNLMIIYNDAIKLDPYNLANAISSLDCWAEQQEENWQIWDINQCKEDFLNSMHMIYENIEKQNNTEEENKEEEKSVSVVTENNEKEILQIIYFDFDKSDLSKVSIDKINKFIKVNKNIINKYLIIGHTDTKGSEKYNFNLSLERAQAVKKIFINNGINENKIKIIGEGESNLLIETKDEVSHPANRRAEISPLN